MVARQDDNLTPEQQERVALWLDGQDVALSPHERDAAQALREAEAHLASQAGVTLPPLAMARAQRTVVLGLRQQRLARWRFAGSLAAAAAAAVLIAVSVLVDAPAPLAPPSDNAKPAVDLAALYAPAPDVEMDLLDRQAQECRTQIHARPSLDDLRIDAIEKYYVEAIFRPEPTEF